MTCIEGIQAGYRKKQILRNLSLDVRDCEIVALVGPNGAGKSTLLKVAIGLIQPWEGSVRLNGRDITRLPPHERVKQGLAYLMQGGKIFPSLTVKENIEMGAFTVPSKERQVALENVLEVFPMLAENLNRRAGLLSGGQRQALALGMVLCQKPKILLLDEPSAGLAPGLSREVLRKLQEVCRRLEIGALVAEQNVAAVLEIADRTVALVNGTVTASIEGTNDKDAKKQLELLFLRSWRDKAELADDSKK